MMNNRDDKSSDLGQIVSVPCVVDERGSLCFVENSHLPFEVKRVFWIYGVAEGMTRGGHAHRTCAEVVFPVKGAFDMFVDDGKSQVTVRMDDPCKGIHIPPNVWCCLSNFEEGTICVVLASQSYDADGYIHNYEDFKLLFG